MTELASEAPTHWHASTACESKIDRLFVASPPWLLCQTAQLVSVRDEPHELAHRGISDHSPLEVIWRPRDHSKMKRQRPLPRWVYKDKIYAQLVSHMESQVGIEDLAFDPPRMLAAATA
eukprot:8818583-Pyramimonas_sp.AAC.1